MRRAGFTLVELMVTILVATLLLAIAAPFFGNASLSGQLTANSNNLLSSLMLARSEAIKRNSSVTVCASADGANCAASGNWEQGWIVTASVSGAATVLRYQQAAPRGFVIKGSDTGGTTVRTLSFPPVGLLSSSYSFKVCRQLPAAGSQERSLSLSTTGRANITRTSTGACP